MEAPASPLHLPHRTAPCETVLELVIKGFAPILGIGYVALIPHTNGDYCTGEHIAGWNIAGGGLNPPGNMEACCWNVWQGGGSLLDIMATHWNLLEVYGYSNG